MRRRYVSSIDELELVGRFFTYRGALRWVRRTATGGQAWVVSRVERDGSIRVLSSMPKLLVTSGVREAFLRSLREGRRS